MNNLFKSNIEPSIESKRIIGDVLFINGCEPKFCPYSYRYRILNQIEQLYVGNLYSLDIYYLNLNPNIVGDFRVLLFYLCPWTEKIEEAIIIAKKLKKKIIFDIDNYIFDKNYFELNQYFQNLSLYDKINYNDYIIRIKKTLELCDTVITTNEILSKQIQKYFKNIYINHNVASEEMFKLSLNALKENLQTKNDKEIIIGYFIDGISFNKDIDSIIPSIIKIMIEFKNVKILIIDGFEYSNKLLNLSSRIIKIKLNDLNELPQIISMTKINIYPLSKNHLNEARSENNWIQASLVKVPTIASNLGIFKKNIINGETGFLCNNTEDWYKTLKSLIIDNNLQKNIGENAYKVCKNKYYSLETGIRFSKYINLISNKHIGFVLPSLEISGGVKVVLVHASILQNAGWDVDLLVPETNLNIYEFENHNLNVISINNSTIISQYDSLVGTLYSTIPFILNYSKTKRRLYLVQSYETDFYSYGEYLRIEAEKTYSISFGIEYITISKWCEKWLIEKYNQNPRYAPNGIDITDFIPHKRDLNKSKIRILIEGDCSSSFKNVDESFNIIEKLDKDKFEIWYMSYNSNPKNWYKVDKFLNKVPFDRVQEVYEQCDILLKSSWLDSFSYPPLEMMATGGYCIVVATGGNEEYLKDGENCLFYKLGDIDSAVQCILHLIQDKELQKNLYENGIETAKKRDWKNFINQIINLYK